MAESLLPLPNLLTGRPQRPVPVEDEKDSCSGSESDGSIVYDGKSPSQEYVFFGVDFKPVLPAVFTISTVVGGLCLFVLQIPLLSRLTGISQAWMDIGAATVYFLVVSCMVYCAWADPGQVNKVQEIGEADIEEGVVGPPRAHKSWQYPLPIRRYDHFCRFLRHVIGLWNHREFVTMLFGLVVIASGGVLIDTWLAVLVAKKGWTKIVMILAFHGGYSVSLLLLAGPILKIHLTLISRSMTGFDEKNKTYHVAHGTSLGDNVPVEKLEDDEYNDYFDQNLFQYSPERNPYDKGLLTNCFNFWCQPRWSPDATGDF